MGIVIVKRKWVIICCSLKGWSRLAVVNIAPVLVQRAQGHKAKCGACGTAGTRNLTSFPRALLPKQCPGPFCESNGTCQTAAESLQCLVTAVLPKFRSFENPGVIAHTHNTLLNIQIMIQHLHDLQTYQAMQLHVLANVAFPPKWTGPHQCEVSTTAA